MAPAIPGYDPLPLTEFYIVPRETIRACLLVFEKAKDHANQYFMGYDPYAEQNRRLVKRILWKEEHKWPLIVQADSARHNQIKEMMSEAIPNLDYRKDQKVHRIMEKYIVQFPHFWADGIILDDNAKVVGGDCLILKHPKVETETSSEKLEWVYLDLDLDEEASQKAFEKMIKAAEFKSKLFPCRSSRLESWPRETCEALLNVPNEINDIVSFNFDAFKILNSAITRYNSDTDLQHKSHSHSITESEAAESIFTPSMTRASSPAPTERPAAIDVSNNSQLKVSYLAVLETPTTKVTLDINSARVGGQGSEVLDIAKDMWEILSSRPYGAKVSLEGVVRLAAHVVLKDDGIVSTNTTANI